MPSESVIVEVRADEVQAGVDELNTSAPWPTWMLVEQAKPITYRSSGEVVWIEFRGNSGAWWERARLGTTVIVRRPAPSPSGAEEGDDWLTDVIDVMLDDETCDCEGPRLDLTRCSVCDRRLPSAGARKPGGQAEACVTFPAGYLPMDCPCCGRRRLEYGVNAHGDVVYVKCEKCGADSERETLDRNPGAQA